MVKTIDRSQVPAAALAAIEAKEANKKPPVNNTELVEQFRASGGHILHIRPKKPNKHRAYPTRGMTAAFVVKGARITLATSLAHPNDDFCKKDGTKTAIEHFLDGRVVTLPIPRDAAKRPVHWLHNVLFQMTI